MPVVNTIPPLKGGENWLPWSLRMRALLMEEGLDQYIKCSSLEYLNQGAAYLTGDSARGRVMGLILCHMDDSIFGMFDWKTVIRTSPRELWKQLQAKFAPEEVADPLGCQPS